MAKKIKVVLLKPVRNLGNAYDVVEVSPPYFKNVLQKQWLANIADKATLDQLAQRQQQKQQEQEKQRQAFDKMIRELQAWLIIKKKATDAGNLYDKVDEREIAKTINHLYWLNLTKSDIKIPHKLESVGIYPVKIKFQGKEVEIQVDIQRN